MLVFLLNILCRSLCYDLSQVVFVILSQANKYHAGIGEETKQNLVPIAIL
jgi:hypothetical protein